MREFLFISHSNPEDNEFARWLALQLAKEGYPVWCDLTKLLGGEVFWENIEEAVRQRTAKFLYVLSCSSNSKPGPRNELALASAVKRRDSIKDFIIPLWIDSLAAQDFNVEIARLNAIPFQTGWALGLAQLLKKLEEDSVPKKPTFGPAAVASWWREAMAATGGLQEKPETLITNWYPLQPTTLYFHKLGRDLDFGPGRVTQDKTLPFPAVQHNQYVVTFTEAEQLRKHLEAGLIVEESTACELGGTDYSGRISGLWTIQEEHSTLSTLMRLAWERVLVERGLKAYQFANGNNGLYFTNGQIPNNRVLFTGVAGDKSRRDIIGFKTLKHAGESPPSIRYWHFCLEARPMVRPFLGYTMLPHVLFSDDGVIVWSSKDRLHRARRAQCKDWWNDKWRDLIQAVVSWLASGDSAIVISLGGVTKLKLNAVPFMLESPFSFDEHAAGPPCDDDSAQSEDDEETNDPVPASDPEITVSEDGAGNEE